MKLETEKLKLKHTHKRGLAAYSILSFSCFLVINTLFRRKGFQVKEYNQIFEKCSLTKPGLCMWLHTNSVERERKRTREGMRMRIFLLSLDHSRSITFQFSRIRGFKFRIVSVNFFPMNCWFDRIQVQRHTLDFSRRNLFILELHKLRRYHYLTRLCLVMFCL